MSDEILCCINGPEDVCDFHLHTEKHSVQLSSVYFILFHQSIKIQIQTTIDPSTVCL